MTDGVRTKVALACLFVLALLVRAVYLFESSSNPTFFAPVVDSETYDRLASAFAAGQELTDEFFWQPPFYPLFLGVVYRLTGSSIVWAKVLQALIGTATCWLTFQLGRIVFDRRAGVLAALFVALYGPLIFFDAELLATSWAAFWTVALILLFVWARRSDRLPPFFVLGAAGALSVLTRPTFLPFFVASAVWLAATLCRERMAGRGAVAARLSLVVVGFLAVSAPAAHWSHAISGRWSILPASSGINLFIGNNPDAARTISIRPGWEWEELTRRPERFGVLRKQETGRFFRGQVLEFARDHPLDFLGGLARKTGHFLSSRELPRNVDVYVFRDWSVVLRTLVWKVGGFGFPFGLLLPLAGMGLVLGHRKLPPPIPIFLLLYPASIILVFVSARYRTPVVPLLSVLAAGGLLDLGRRIREKEWARLALAAGAAATLVVLATLPGPFPQERANYRAEVHYSVGTRAMNAGDLESAVEHLGRAVEIQPLHSDARNHLGIAYSKLGRLSLATECFGQAVRDAPRFVTTRVNYARLLAAQGRFEEATRQLRIGLEQQPDNAELQYRLGEVLGRK